MTIDWDSILEGGEDDIAIPEDTYTVRVEKTEAVLASTGKPMVKLTVEVIAGPYAGRWVWTNIVFSTPGEPMKSGAARMLRRRLKAFGLDSDYLTTHNPTHTQIAESILGMTVDAEVIQKTYQKELQNDVNMFYPVGGGASHVPSAPTVPGAPPTPKAPPVPVVEDVIEAATAAVQAVIPAEVVEAEVVEEAPAPPPVPPTPPLPPTAPTTPTTPAPPTASGVPEAPF